MDALERYTMLMEKLDTNPRHWRAVWLKDDTARAIYLHDPLIKVSQALVIAIIRLDADALNAFLVALNAFALAIAVQYPEYQLGSEAAALSSMIKLPVFATVKKALPPIAIAGLVTVLLDDLDEATTVFCANCETRLEQIRLDPHSLVHLCPECDRHDPRWYQDITCMGEDKHLRVQAALRGVVGESGGASYSR
jgi:hypothetical protein